MPGFWVLSIDVWAETGDEWLKTHKFPHSKVSLLCNILR